MTTVSLDAQTARSLVRPLVNLPEQRDARVDIAGGRLRVRACSSDYSTFVDATLPIADCEGDGTAYSFWTNIDTLWGFLGAYQRGTVTLTPPTTAPDNRFVLDGAGLRCRGAIRDPATTYPLPTVKTDSALATCAVSQSDFNRSVQTANLVGSEIQVTINPKQERVTFSATPHAHRDTFRYVLHDESIDDLDGVGTARTISITTLREITPIVPDGATVALALKPNRVVYRVAFPTTNAALVVSIAERHDALD